MKKTRLILLGGLLFISLSHGSNNNTPMQAPCAAHSQVKNVMACPLTSEVTTLVSPNATAAQTTIDLQEQVEEQKVALTSRLMQLVDAFAKLVMVI